MASNDFFSFAPSESAYTNPDEYRSSMNAMALERATTMSELERFYRSLEENQRQFDENLGFQREELESKETMFDKQLGEQRYEFGAQLGQRKQEFGQTFAEGKRQFGETHELETRRFEFEEEMGPQWLALQKSIASSQQSQAWSQNDQGWMAGGMSLLGNWDSISSGGSSIWDTVSGWFG